MSEIHTQNVLMIFVKNPRKGRVKTRLAESIGEDEALEVYQKLLSVTKAVSDNLKCCRQVWYSSFIEQQDLWTDGDYEKRLQSGSNLGERMAGAFNQAFGEGYKRVVIIGSDCPGLKSPIIEKAFHLLDEKQVVIGPSQDGGYYLMGMNNFYPELFEGIAWSTPSVLDQTIKQINTMRFTFKALPALNDIDTEEDLIKTGLESKVLDTEAEEGKTENQNS